MVPQFFGSESGRRISPPHWAAPPLRLERYGLSVEKTAGALSTALTLSVGTSSPARSPAASRWLTLGAAAANGVLAATAARNGLVGPDDLLEQYLGRIAGVRISRKLLLKDLGRSYLLDEAGMKPFPTARQGLAAIEACRELVAAEHIDVASIQEIVVGVPESQRWVIDHPEPPADRMASIVSVQYQIALALLSPARLMDIRRSPVFLNDRIRALMTKSDCPPGGRPRKALSCDMAGASDRQSEGTPIATHTPPSTRRCEQSARMG